MAWKTTITDVGLALINQSLVNGDIVFTRAVGADGTIDAEDLSTVTNLVGANHDMSIVKMKDSDNGKKFTIRMTNTPAVGYMLRQVGLFAKMKTDSSDILLAIGYNEDGEEIPSNITMPEYILEFNMIIPNFTNSNATITVDPNMIVTQDDLKSSIMDGAFEEGDTVIGWINNSTLPTSKYADAFHVPSDGVPNQEGVYVQKWMNYDDACPEKICIFHSWSTKKIYQRSILNNEWHDENWICTSDGGNADTAKETSTSTGKARLWEDSEGGNLRLTSPDGNHYAEMGVYDNQTFRIYCQPEGMGPMFGFYMDMATGKGNINGNADTLDGRHSTGYIRYTDLGSVESDCNIIRATGQYHCSNWINYPTGLSDGQGTMIVYNYHFGNGEVGENDNGTLGTNTAWLRQEFISPHVGTTWYRYIVNTVVSPWLPSNGYGTSVNNFGTDFNSYVCDGFYEVQGRSENPAVNAPTNGHTNQPLTNCNYHLQVKAFSEYHILQIAYSVRYDQNIFSRSMIEGKWSPWSIIDSKVLICGAGVNVLDYALNLGSTCSFFVSNGATGTPIAGLYYFAELSSPTMSLSDYSKHHLLLRLTSLDTGSVFTIQYNMGTTPPAWYTWRRYVECDVEGNADVASLSSVYDIYCGRNVTVNNNCHYYGKNTSDAYQAIVGIDSNNNVCYGSAVGAGAVNSIVLGHPTIPTRIFSVDVVRSHAPTSTGNQLRNIALGTAEATTTLCTPGALYGQYE